MKTGYVRFDYKVNGNNVSEECYCPDVYLWNMQFNRIKAIADANTIHSTEV